MKIYKNTKAAKNAVGSYVALLNGKEFNSKEFNEILTKIRSIEEAYSLPPIEVSESESSLELVVAEDFEIKVAKKYTQLLCSAKRRNKEFNLTLADVRKLLNRKTCAYTGVRFSSENLRTIDRIDSKKGYVKGNVTAVTDKVNLIKNALLENQGSELLIDIKKLRKFCDKMDELGIN